MLMACKERSQQPCATFGALWVARNLEWTVNGTCRHHSAAYGGRGGLWAGPKLLVWIIFRCSRESDGMEHLGSYATQLGEILQVNLVATQLVLDR